MSQPKPFVRLAVGAIRCINPDMIAEHGEDGVRQALALWCWRRELSDTDVAQVIVTLRYESGMEPIETGEPYPLAESSGPGRDGDDAPTVELGRIIPTYEQSTGGGE